MSDGDGGLDQLNHHSEAFAQDRYAIYRALRDRGGITHTSSNGGHWVVSRYADVARVARDPGSFKSGTGILIPGRTYDIPIETDPPEFYGYRHLLNPAFSPAAMDRMEGDVREITNGLIDEFVERGSCNLHDEFAVPLPAIVTFKMLGFPVERWRELAVFDPEEVLKSVGAADTDLAKEDDIPHAAAHELIEEIIKQRRAKPEDDLVSALVVAEIDGRPLTDEELVPMVRLLINGGLLTTTDAIGNLLLYLSRNPEVRQRLIDEPELRVTAIEESLRYESPVTSHARTVATHCQVGDQELEPGERVLMLWGSANRDPEEFPDPTTFVVDRAQNRHLAFGWGIHKCLGLHLARLELRMALDEVLRRIPDFHIEESGVIEAQHVGIVFGRLALPAVFTPNERLGEHPGRSGR